MSAELEPGTRVGQQSPTSDRWVRTGTLVRYETKYRTRWAMVRWDGRQFVDREYPDRIQPLPRG